jgi:predicted permease
MGRIGQQQTAGIVSWFLALGKPPHRDQRGFPRLEAVVRDFRIACRMLRRAPSVSVPAIVVLALGIGAGTALYAIAYAMWLRPLPYPDASRLISITTYFAGHNLDALLSPDYGTWQGSRSAGPLAAYSVYDAVLIGPSETLQASRARVSGNMFNVLRVPAAMGRAIQPADDTPEADRVVALSHSIWQSQFGAADVIGRAVRIDGEAHTIIGIMPPRFRMPGDRRADLFTPLALSASWLNHSPNGGIAHPARFGALQPGVSLEQARADFSGLLAGSISQLPKLYGNDVSLRLIPLDRYESRDVRTAAIVLSAAVLCILLIAASNVASLLVARAAGRSQEMSIRRALGASAGQITRQLLAEGLTLGVAGTAAGLVIARALLAFIPRLRAAASVHVEDVAMNAEVVTAAAGFSLLCSLAFSLAPALRAPRLPLRRALVACELALSLVLLIAAALLVESLWNLRAISPGFHTERLVAASISLKGSRFAGSPGELRRELRDRLFESPGVIAVAFADALPPSDSTRTTTFSRADRPLPEPFHRGDNMIVRRVDPSFFQTLGIPLREGRLLTAADQRGTGPFAVVNRTLAERFFPDESPIGKQVDGLGLPWKTVVGVVGDTRNDGLRNPTSPEMYVPFTNDPPRGGGVTSDHGLNVVIRTEGDPAAISSLLRGHLRGLDPALLASTRTMDERWAELNAAPRFQAAVFTCYALLAMSMAGFGIYGVLSHVVTLRKREIGIRMALGARPLDVQGLVLREALALGATASCSAREASSRVRGFWGLCCTR